MIWHLLLLASHVYCAGLLFGLGFRKGYSVTFISSYTTILPKVVKWNDDDDQIHENLASFIASGKLEFECIL